MYQAIALCGNPSISYEKCASASEPDDGSILLAIEWGSSVSTTTTPINTAFTSKTTTVITLLLMLVAICVSYFDRISNTAIQIWYGA